VDFDQYVAARYGRLIEHAVLLGCAEGEAGPCVDRVLLAQRKRIRRADDPDPLVHEALERAIGGHRARSRRTGPLVALGLVVVAVSVGAALTYRPPPRPVPSLFALDGSQAQRLLEDQGFDVLLRPARSCEPAGLVLESDPPAGARLRKGATVTVRTAVASGVYCQALFLARADAWEFVRFALGHDVPAFADTVRLIVQGSEPPRNLTREEAADGARWGAVFDLVATASHEDTPTSTGMPSLWVDVTLPPDLWCGRLRPPETGERFALRLKIDARSPRAGGCPLTIDLYRSERVIDTVVVYPATAGG
jgi:hypothetical protein